MEEKQPVKCMEGKTNMGQSSEKNVTLREEQHKEQEIKNTKIFKNWEIFKPILKYIIKKLN